MAHLALNEEAVTNSVLWAGKPESQIVGKIAWLEKEQETYANYGPYILKVPEGYVKPNDEYETTEDYCDICFILQKAE